MHLEKNWIIGLLAYVCKASLKTCTNSENKSS